SARRTDAGAWPQDRNLERGERSRVPHRAGGWRSGRFPADPRAPLAAGTGRASNERRVVGGSRRTAAAASLVCSSAHLSAVMAELDPATRRGPRAAPGMTTRTRSDGCEAFSRTGLERAKRGWSKAKAPNHRFGAFPNCRVRRSVYRRALGGFLAGLLLDPVLHFFEGADLDLADALAADIVFLGQLFERRRIFLETAGLEDRLFAIVEVAHGVAQKRHALVELLALTERSLLVRRVVDQPVLPLRRALVGAHRRVERSVATEPLVHRHDVFLRDLQGRGDLLDLVRMQIAVVQRCNLALHLAQVEEQPLLGSGRSDLHERPATQHVLLNRRSNPPHCVGCEAEA